MTGERRAGGPRGGIPLWLDRLRQDVVLQGRSLRRSPTVAAAIVLTLALGLGVNTAMFSLLDVLYFRPPAGVTDPGGVHRVWQQIRFRSGMQYWPSFDYPSFRAVREAVDEGAITALYSPPRQARMTRGEHAPTAAVSYVSADYFPLLGVQAVRGRVFTRAEDQLGAPTDVAVVSDAFWRRQMNDARDALGRSLTVGTRQFTIVGVGPPGFAGVDLDAVDVWLPLAAFGGLAARPWWEDRNVNGFQLLLRPRADVEARQLEMRIMRALHRPELLFRPGDTLTVAKLGPIVKAAGPGKPQQEIRIAERLGAVALLVLLISVANVVNLLLARAVGRRREIAVRLALGISRPHLIEVLVTEAVLLATVAGAASVAAGAWAGETLRALLLPQIQWAVAPLHWRVLAFCLAVTFAAGLVAGLIPALQAVAPDLTRALKAGSHQGTAPHARLRSTLVLLQVALSVVLLVGAGLFLRSLNNVRHLDLGYDADHLVFGEIAFDTRDSTRDARIPQEFAALADHLRAVPGVRQVALASMRPMYGFSFTRYFPDADTLAHKTALPTFTAVSPEYFQATGIRLLRGSGFPPGEASRTVVINEALARALWPGENPVGRCMRFEKPDAPCYTITGIVETARRDRVIEDPEPQYYLPLGRMPVAGYPARTLVVRADLAARTLVVAEMQAELRHTFPSGVPVITRMSDELEPQYRPWRLGATLFSLFGILALLVASVGIYSSIAYGMSQRVHEFGVRTALGASRTDVLREVVAGALRQVGLGVGVGIALALAGGRLVAALLYGVRSSDPLIVVAVAVVLLCVAVAAAFVPAWRAARADPLIALRAE